MEQGFFGLQNYGAKFQLCNSIGAAKVGGPDAEAQRIGNRAVGARD